MSTFGNYTLLYGQNIDKEFNVDDNELLTVMKKISEIDFDSINTIKPKRISKFRMVADTKRFIDSYYKVHKVGFLSDERLVKALNKRFVFSDRDVAKVFNDSIRYVNPFFIPIEYSQGDVFGGSLVCQMIIQEGDYNQDEFLSMLNPCFSRITLPKVTTQISPISYVHEITHTQVVSNTDSVENFYNNEVLSIYNELLFAYRKGIEYFKLDVLNRMKYAISKYYSLHIYKHGDKSKLDSDYDEYKFHTDAKYLQSILIAFNLIIKTIGGDASLILKQVQNVFDGKITVEQFLSKVSSSYEDSKDTVNVEKLLKKIK